MNEKPFSLDVNLDDEQEATTFWHEHCISSVPRVARKLGLKGKGSHDLASALRNYAINKVVACKCRKKGDIQTALSYEKICDDIYKRDISPVCDCW